ncbi:MAG: inositol monophosphatase [Phycisphaerae bacterium]|nr:inositol monophosphatase [Phycisphaerae bacterium]
MASSTDVSVLFDAAVRLAEWGGEIATSRIGEAKTTRKADRTFITQVDLEIQDALLGVIAREFPDHAVLAEEEQSDPSRHRRIEEAEHCWVIDPLDGTRNFSRGVPMFATSVAIMREGRPIVAAICGGVTGQVFAAVAGGGATMDGQPTRVRDEPPNRDSMIAVRGKSGAPAAPVIHRWINQYCVRTLGSAALHLAFVGAGITDAAYHQQCKLWDLAAGALLVEAGGGVITTPAGEPIFPVSLRAYHGQDMGFLAAGPGLHAHLLGESREG